MRCAFDRRVIRLVMSLSIHPAIYPSVYRIILARPLSAFDSSLIKRSSRVINTKMSVWHSTDLNRTTDPSSVCQQPQQLQQQRKYSRLCNKWISLIGVREPLIIYSLYLIHFENWTFYFQFRWQRNFKKNCRYSIKSPFNSEINRQWYTKLNFELNRSSSLFDAWTVASMQAAFPSCTATPNHCNRNRCERGSDVTAKVTEESSDGDHRDLIA